MSQQPLPGWQPSPGNAPYGAPPSGAAPYPPWQGQPPAPYPPIRHRSRAPFILGGVLLLLLAVAASGFAILPTLATQDPDKVNVSSRLTSPSRTHWRGTDNLGRDIFARQVRGIHEAIPGPPALLWVVAVLLLIGAVLLFTRPRRIN